MKILRSPVVLMFIGFLLAVGVGFLIFALVRTDEPEVGVKARAELMSPSGEVIGAVDFTQGEASLLISAEARGLEPGGHAFIIHSVGACTPDFMAAGDHFDQDEGGRGFVHSNWNRRDPTGRGHSGDLPNLYAASDGSARADFFATGVTIQSGQDDSLFDADGSSIIIYEKPSNYQDDSDTGERIACGVIRPA